MPDSDFRHRKNSPLVSSEAVQMNGNQDDDSKEALLPGEGERKHNSRGLAGDWGSIALLSLLYTLQGIPMGLSGSIPLLLAKKVGYADQAIFSFCSWPFSLKLFWAPIVDSCYLPTVGRRKSWLVPVQLLCGAMMVFGAGSLDLWTGESHQHADGSSSEEAPQPDTKALTAYFFTLYFLMATQDIAVDGWALTMLRRENVGYASTCNSVGQTLGYFIAFVGFIALNDAATCNKYLRAEPVAGVGLVTLSGFVRFWGYVFVATTAYVWAFKPEAPEPKVANSEGAAVGVESGSSSSSRSLAEKGWAQGASGLDGLGLGGQDATVAITDGNSNGAAKANGVNKENGNGNSNGNGHGSSNGHPEEACDNVEEDNAGVVETYKQLWAVLQLPAMQTLVVVLLTCKVGFAVTDAATTLKFIEYGVPKESMAYFSPAFIIIGVVVPLIVGKFTNGPKPLSVFLVGAPLRLVSGFVLAGVLRHTKDMYAPAYVASHGEPGASFWALFLSASALNNVAGSLMFVAQMSFFAKISDPAIGGTYMTLLNTVANLGSKWPTSLALALLDQWTTRECRPPADAPSHHHNAFHGLVRRFQGGSSSRDGDVNWPSLECAAGAATSACTTAGGSCHVIVDGYDVELVVCTVLGIAWLVLLGRTTYNLQNLRAKDWAISH